MISTEKNPNSKTVKDNILALVPDDESLNEMLSLCFNDQSRVFDQEEIASMGILSATIAFFIANCTMNGGGMHQSDFNAVGINHLSDDELAFSAWLLTISGNQHLITELAKTLKS